MALVFTIDRRRRWLQPPRTAFERGLACPPPALPVLRFPSLLAQAPSATSRDARTGVLLCPRISPPRRAKAARMAHPAMWSAKLSSVEPTPASNRGAPLSRPTLQPPRLGKAPFFSVSTALVRLSPTSPPPPQRLLPRCHFLPCTRCCPLSVVPLREHHTDLFSLPPACVPRGLASTGPGRGGKGCLIAARRSAAKRPTGGLPTRQSHVSTSPA